MKEEALKLLERQPESLEDWVLYALDCDDMIRKLVTKIEVTERNYNFIKDYAIGLENSIKQFCATAKAIDKGEF